MNATTNRKSLRDRAKEFSVQLPFMEGREKGELKELYGQISNIIDYGFLTGEKGDEYVAFITAERSNKFYFGGMVLTEQIMVLDAEGYREDIVTEGLPVLLNEKKSKKSNRGYTTVEFYPEI